MKVYNTLTKSKEEFVPIEEGKVRMYVCGPTVYNYIHIGNARPIIVFDTVRRYLEYKGYDVNYVSNFTDVDDKIIKRAMEENVPACVISERFIAECKKEMEGLSIKPATAHPKATEEIDGMIEIIEILIKKGFAYEKNGTVYFRTRKFPQYGKLSKKNLDELEAGIRIAVSDEKEDSMDFVLWKPKKEGEISWQSPWGEGRPGWHIECSAMSKKYLGDQIDIHAGGEDLVFPHHENEIAQSEAANGKEFSKYWMHNAFLNINNKKMSKSEGEALYVKDVRENYDLSVLRFFMLSAHYRSPLNYSGELMESSKVGLERIMTAVSNLMYLSESAEMKDQSDAEKDLCTQIQVLQNKYEEAMEDDFNTADAISAIFEMVKAINSVITSQSSKQTIHEVLNKVTMLCGVLGLNVKKEKEILDDEIEQLIQDRQDARKKKDFVKSDQIRDLLLGKGIVLEDTREGVKWKRV